MLFRSVIAFLLRGKCLLNHNQFKLKISGLKRPQIIWSIRHFVHFFCCLMTVRLFRLRQKLFFEGIFIEENDWLGTFVCVKLFLIVNFVLN